MTSPHTATFDPGTYRSCRSPGNIYIVLMLLYLYGFVHICNYISIYIYTLYVCKRLLCIPYVWPYTISTDTLAPKQYVQSTLNKAPGYTRSLCLRIVYIFYIDILYCMLMTPTYTYVHLYSNIMWMMMILYIYIYINASWDTMYTYIHIYI